MPINFLRIDDRLIHGQVVVAWIKNFSSKRVLIVDDLVAKDDFLLGVMRMVAPSGIELVVKSREGIENTIKKYEEDSINTIILVKTPMVAQYLFDHGLTIKLLNVGGMGYTSKRKQLYQNVSASEEEIEVLKNLEDRGINVYFQTTPGDRQVKISNVK
ncbi:MAG: PTS sugar transporter subunit IIB [Bacilli bacterium]